jgi:glutamine synthetase
MMVAAGLEGIEQSLDAGEPNRENLYYKTEEERQEMGAYWLPRTLEEAASAFEQDPLSRQIFGGKIFDSWVETKRAEWNSYINHVSDWEVNQYLNKY